MSIYYTVNPASYSILPKSWSYFCQKGNDIGNLVTLIFNFFDFWFQMSYWRQFEQGMLSREAVRKLHDCTDTAADKQGK